MALSKQSVLINVVVTLWCVLLGSVFSQVTSRLGHTSAGQQSVVTPPPLSLLSTSVLNTVTLGYRGLYDDFADIWLLQTLGEKDVKRFDPQQLITAIRSVTRHGPKLESLYLLSCFVLTFELAKPEECQAISVDGMKALPTSWRIPMTQGYVTAFVLNDPGAGALYYQLAGSLQGAPPFLASLATKLAAHGEFSDEEKIHIKKDFLESIGIDLEGAVDHAK